MKFTVFILNCKIKKYSLCLETGGILLDITKDTILEDNDMDVIDTKKIEDQIRNRKRKMAICYDFDKTLSPDDMQSFTLIPSLQMDKSDFWNQSNDLARENLMDNNLAWMFQLLTLSKAKRKSIKREYFNEVGKSVPLYNGVESWFDRVNKYAERKNIEVEHYIISSGLKEIIEGSVIANKFKRIYASSYLYSTDGIAEWPAQAVNYTNKTQYIFRIAKGIFNEYDERVNDSMNDSELHIPYENIVYIGDSATDIPCMRLVRSKGGYSIGVYDPDKRMKDKVYKLYGDGRLSYYTAADYTARSELMVYMKTIIDEIDAKENIKTERKILDTNASVYKMFTEMVKIRDLLSNEDISKKEQRDLDRAISNARELLDNL